MVLLADSGRTTVRFARTAADGRFSIDSRTKSGNTAFALLFTAMGYEKDTIAIAGFRNGQTVIMPEKSLQIKEVRVVAPRIVSRGDTLSYMVNSFKQKQDRSIADVIRKMPGLNVNDDGSIEYQGRRINKFYIEGMDLLGSKYAQASENIPADKVGSVQVLENHQPVKMLRGNSFSGQAALNITLKGEARGVWQATAGAAAGTAIQNGAGALADCRLTAMLFARKMQSMSMYKFNNTGKDIMSEATDKYAFGYRPPEVQPLTSGISIAQPSLEHGRTSFNTSNMLATNWLVKTRHGHDLRMQLTAMHDRSAMSAYSETLHTDIDGNAMVTQSNEATATRREMEGEVTYQVNDGGIYLTNTLHAGGSWNKSRGSSVFNGNGTHLEAIPQKGSLGNAFSMTKRMKGGNSLSLSAYLSHSYLPAGSLPMAAGSS